MGRGRRVVTRAWAGADGRITCVIAFHEKAGRSQVGSGCFLLVTDIVSAELPLSPPFHPHSL